MLVTNRSSISYVDKYLAGTTPYFFTNFPDDFGNSEMWKVIYKWGKVWDIYIPKKRDKLGKKYGFVKFKDVNNVKVLEKQLDSIWIGSYRLIVNLAKFDRRQEKVSPTVPRLGPHFSLQGGNCVRNGSSYANVVSVGKEGTKGTNYKALNAQEKDEWKGLTFNVPEEDMGWLEGTFVGEAHDVESSLHMQDNIHSEGIFSINAVPLGGNFVLLLVVGTEDFLNIAREDNKTLSKLFIEICPWSPDFVVRERLVWVNVAGVPAHA